MAVYTEVSDQELATFLRGYDIGRAVSFKGIAEGVENSNYLLHTDQGAFILTLYEKRVAPEDLPYFLGLMEHLAGEGQCLLHHVDVGRVDDCVRAQGESRLSADLGGLGEVH